MASEHFRRTKQKEFRAKITSFKVGDNEFYRMSVPKHVIQHENIRKGSEVKAVFTEVSD